MSLPAEVFEEFPVTCMVLLSIIVLSIAYVIVKRRIKVDVGEKEITIGDEEESVAKGAAPAEDKPV